MKRLCALGLLLLVAAVHCQPLLPPEFTAKLDIKWGEQSYDATVYVNTKTLSAPVIQARAKASFTPNDKGPQRVVSSVYVSSLPGVFNFLTGFSNAEGAINLEEADCFKLPIDQVLDQSTGSFAPVPVDQSKKPLAPVYKKACADCDGAFTTTVYRQLLTVLTKNRIPKIIIGPDRLLVVVTDFKPTNTLNLKDEAITVPCNVLKQKVLANKPAAMPELIPAEQKKQIKLRAGGAAPIHKHPAFPEHLAKHIMGKLYEEPKKLPPGDAKKKDPKVDPMREPPSPRREDTALRPGPSPIAIKARFSAVQVSCDPTFRGDGECDAECNNADNNWDFGDCCEGTCKLVEYYTRLLPREHLLNLCRRGSCGSKGYDCKIPRKKAHCAFYHGFLVNGKPPADNGPEAFSGTSPLQANAKYGMRYWADMARELEGLCESVVYNNHETITNGWDEVTLQNTYYDHALQVTQRADLDGLRPALFAHSMANMLLGGACMHQGKCAVKWTDLSGPIRGSRVALNPIASGLSRLGMKAISTLRPDFDGLATSPANKDVLSAVIAGKLPGRGAPSPSPLLAGAACGYKGVGALMSPHLLPMAAVKFIVYGYSAKADGVVGMDECELYGIDTAGNHEIREIGLFSDTDPLHPYYHYPGNHMTATGSEGDAGFMLTYIRSQVDGFARDFLANVARDADPTLVS